MSHFKVGVIIPKEVKEQDLEREVDKALSPFNVSIKDNERIPKWDWYEIGGKWDKAIETIDSQKVNYAYIKDIMFTKKFDSIQLKRIEKDYKKLIEEGGFFSPDFYQRKFPTLQSFIDNKNFVTYTILNKDGEWYEDINMGCVGIFNSEYEYDKMFREKYANFIKDLDQEDWLVLVDCHNV